MNTLCEQVQNYPTFTHGSSKYIHEEGVGGRGGEGVKRALPQNATATADADEA
jgi:hypothetical protein